MFAFLIVNVLFTGRLEPGILGTVRPGANVSDLTAFMQQQSKVLGGRLTGPLSPPLPTSVPAPSTNGPSFATAPTIGPTPSPATSSQFDAARAAAVDLISHLSIAVGMDLDVPTEPPPNSLLASAPPPTPALPPEALIEQRLVQMARISPNRVEREHHEEEWGDSITRCVCGYDVDDGFMICCDHCKYAMLPRGLLPHLS